MFYASIEQVSNFANSNGFQEWDELDENEKKQILFVATNDIEKSLNIPRTSPRMPFGRGDIDLTMACEYQAINVMQTKPFRDMALQIGTLTNGEYSDGIISIDSLNPNTLHSIAGQLVSAYKKQNNVNTGFEFGRG